MNTTKAEQRRKATPAVTVKLRLAISFKFKTHLKTISIVPTKHINFYSNYCNRQTSPKSKHKTIIMLDKIEMSLDDIIKSNKSSGFKKRGGGNQTRGGNVGKSSPKKQFSGGIAKGRARGGITRSKYTRVR
jgi:hypothetical protein